MHKAFIYGMSRWDWLLLSLLSFAATAADIEAQLLVYRVTEPGAEPYISRLLVTPDSLRIDQGTADVGYILLDRKAMTVYSVNPDDRMILVIAPKPQRRDLPAGLKLSTRQLESPGMPGVSGKQPQHWQFLVNDRLCRSAVVVPGLLPQAARAYAEYLELLAYQQQLAQAAIPAEMQDLCNMVIHIYTPTAVLDKGLPLKEWNALGRHQDLIDFRDAYSVPADSFSLPEDYRRIPLNAR